MYVTVVLGKNGVDWYQLAQDKVHWDHLVIPVTKL
jgi:hypothetical protein